ncbi:bifunctional 3'-5' exonuclease/DNA polymerase [Phycicoccus ginsengisoli]
MAVHPVAFVTSPDARAAVVGPGVRFAGPVAEAARVAAGLERDGPQGDSTEGPVRFTWWAAGVDAQPLAERGIPLSRCWDVAEAHRLLHGGWQALPQQAWAAAHGLDPALVPQARRGDLFDFDAGDDEPRDGSVLRPDGHLAAEAGSPAWDPDDGTLLAWGDAALECARLQHRQLAELGDRAVATAHSESAAALLCVELARDGLPLDRTTAEALIAGAAGPRPVDEEDARATRARRDAAVLRHAPGRESTDLRNPAQVKELLAAVGVDVPNTRKWVLEPYRHTHAVVEALLEWRKAERIATTYGYGWLDAHVGPDDRLRGAWTACDGAAGRMTAQNGLHNLPTELRPAVAAHPGHVLVRADLGQIEPRVLAVVSGDPAFATATRADDLYAPVASRLGVERPVAKVAVLAAMYGQRSGAAGEALKGLERAYPVAMGFLDDAYAAGVGRRPLRTFGGRLLRLDEVLTGGAPQDAAGYDAARGRFARNAVIQGSAAELFKAWAATVRATTRDLGAQIVLCLHDELLVHAPQEHAEEVRARVETALTDSARRWAGTSTVRFVADTSVVRRWSEAKG